MKLILFSHHFVNENVINTFNNVKKLNPTWDVISIGFPGNKLLKDSVILNKSKYPNNYAIQYYASQYHVDWYDPDLFIYEGYFKFPNYEEYFLYEYDTICNVSIEEFFNTNVDFFGNNLCVPARENWEWSELYRKHNPYNTHFKTLYAYGQSTCIYFKNHILKQCVDEILKNRHLYCSMLSEIRGGTLVSQFTELKKGRDDISKYISWTTNDITVDLSKPHFYHPVK